MPRIYLLRTSSYYELTRHIAERYKVYTGISPPSKCTRINLSGMALSFNPLIDYDAESESTGGLTDGNQTDSMITVTGSTGTEQAKLLQGLTRWESARSELKDSLEEERISRHLVEAEAAKENHGRYDGSRSLSETTHGATTTGNMFSSDSCFMGGFYYHVRGDAHFSPLLQASHGLEILYRNISTSACHDSRDRFPPPRCHPSTRKDILATIMNHVTETPSSSKIFHLFGSEGTGKSAIAQSFAEYCKSNGILGACFFFSGTSSERNSCQKVIATLAYQLCVTVPELKRFILKAVEDDLSTFQKDIDTQMEMLIIHPIVQATIEGIILGYPIIIVVDGLDECEGVKEQYAFLRAISGAMGRHRLPLYFFMTSRPETHMVNWLNRDPEINPILHQLDLDKHHIRTKKDIEAYLCSEFQRIRKVHHMPDSLVWPGQANIQTLLSKTNMLFRCASEMIEFIDDKKDTPQNRLEIMIGPSNSSDGHSSRSEMRPVLATSEGTNRGQPKHRLMEESVTMLIGRVEVDGLRYRRRPNVQSDAIGQYPIGTKVSITGFTQEGTTVVKGDPRWARLSNGYWVALGNGKYVSWTGSIPQC